MLILFPLFDLVILTEEWWNNENYLCTTNKPEWEKDNSLLTIELNLLVYRKYNWYKIRLQEQSNRDWQKK